MRYEKKTSVVEVSNLSKSFGRRQALDNLSFEVEAGGFLAIFGPNGAGKTTLLKILTTLIPPSAGQVFVGGHSLVEEPTLIRRKIGFISHNPLLYLDLSAYENLKFYGQLYQVANLEEVIDKLLEKVELSHRRYDLVRTFSKGMQQRLAIARTLLHQPQILFLDEPHSGLDPHAVDILDGLLSEIRKDHTFVMVTHSLEKGLNLATQAMILDQGKIIFNQQAEELNPKTLKDIYTREVREAS